MKIKKEGWESSRAAPLGAHHSSKLELWRKTSTWKSSGMSSALSLIPERPPCCARPGANPPSTPLLLFPEHSQSIPRAFPGHSQACPCLSRGASASSGPGGQADTPSLHQTWLPRQLSPDHQNTPEVTPAFPQSPGCLQAGRSSSSCRKYCTGFVLFLAWFLFLIVEQLERKCSHCL